MFIWRGNLPSRIFWSSSSSVGSISSHPSGGGFLLRRTLGISFREKSYASFTTTIFFFCLYTRPQLFHGRRIAHDNIRVYCRLKVCTSFPGATTSWTQSRPWEWSSENHSDLILQTMYFRSCSPCVQVSLSARAWGWIRHSFVCQGRILGEGAGDALPSWDEPLFLVLAFKIIFGAFTWWQMWRQYI